MNTSKSLEEILDAYHQRGCFEFRRTEIARDQATVDFAKRNMKLYTEEAKAAIVEAVEGLKPKKRTINPDWPVKKSQGWNDCVEAFDKAIKEWQ